MADSSAAEPIDPGPTEKPEEKDPTDHSYFGVDAMDDSSAPPYRSNSVDSFLTPGALAATPGTSTPGTPFLTSRAESSHGDNDDFDALPPLDKLTLFDFLENLALPQRIERLQVTLSAQKEKVRRQQQKLKAQGQQARERVVDEWRKRVPPPDERLQRYRRRMAGNVNRLAERFNDTKNVTKREKASFIAGVLNILISGYLIGAFPEYFHLWYTLQFFYFYPLRFYMYRRKGFHYFLADLCYFVNFLLLFTLWVFPQSKRLFISTFCLAFGNNAVAIAMWRNSLVFHSFDKITSLFIHVMPCATLHCIVHLVSPATQRQRFPSIYAIKTASPNSPAHYSLLSMALWSSVPYAIWQMSYHLLITVRRREKIAAGRPTSFTWLRKSYSNTWIGKIVLNLPKYLQEPAFMMIQYSYAIMTMVPVPLWFWNRWASAGFLLSVFTWSVYNGAVYYIDVFGVRFQKELEALKKDVAKWQLSPELAPRSPIIGAAGQVSSSSHGQATGSKDLGDFSLSASAMGENNQGKGRHVKSEEESSEISQGVDIDDSELMKAAAVNAMKGGTESSLVAGTDGLLKRSGGADGTMKSEAS